MVSQQCKLPRVNREQRVCLRWRASRAQRCPGSIEQLQCLWVVCFLTDEGVGHGKPPQLKSCAYLGRIGQPSVVGAGPCLRRGMEAMPIDEGLFTCEISILSDRASRRPAGEYCRDRFVAGRYLGEELLVSSTSAQLEFLLHALGQAVPGNRPPAVTI